MLWLIVGVLLLLWLLGLVLKLVGGVIHVLLVVALLIVVYRLITTRRAS